MTPEQAKELRKPFPRSAIGKLPKAGMQLDYVGHAATTDRLLAVDPSWTWEPAALDEHGLPALQGRNLWIKLTVCGVTRWGVGDGASVKEAIGDAIRNAAMRFGVALDLWSKEELEGAHQGDAPASQPPAQPRNEERLPDEKPMTARTRGQLFALFGQKGIPEDQQLDGINRITGASYTSRGQLSEAHGLEVIEALKKRPDVAKEEAQ
jgi:hypothetical protein